MTSEAALGDIEGQAGRRLRNVAGQCRRMRLGDIEGRAALTMTDGRGDVEGRAAGVWSPDRAGQGQKTESKLNRVLQAGGKSVHHGPELAPLILLRLVQRASDQ